MPAQTRAEKRSSRGEKKKGLPARHAPEKVKRRFLKALADGLAVHNAAMAAGVARDTVYRWRKEDPEFSKAWEEAVEIATDSLETIAYQRAADRSDSLIAFLLKARRPSVYQPRHQVEVTSNVNVSHSLDGPAAELVERLLARFDAMPEPPVLEGNAEKVQEGVEEDAEELSARLLSRHVADDGEEGDQS